MRSRPHKLGKCAMVLYARLRVASLPSMVTAPWQIGQPPLFVFRVRVGPSS